MAETTPPTGTNPQQAGESREIQIKVDESDVTSNYANTIRTSTTFEEVILDFGLNMPVAGQQNQMVFKVHNQVIMNWAGAKRLALSLSQLIRAREERFGEIELQPPGVGAPAAQAKND
ncbi:MAG: DUF3467 domain-containing protein [Phycisphaerales bacterium]|nr:DUF3467 domain-containing protein [Phycisphaerales bacterium]